MVEVRAAFVWLSVRMDVATIAREALSLTVAERALLADRLLRTLDQEDPERMERWVVRVRLVRRQPGG
jgi:heme exporter protein D